MRILTITLLGMLAGCAAAPGELVGTSGKNGGPVRVERLGVATNDRLPEDARCSDRQVLWCRTRDSGRRCQCLYTHDGRAARERLARDPRRQAL